MSSEAPAGGDPPAGFAPLRMPGGRSFEHFVGPIFQVPGLPPGQARFGFRAAAHHANPFGVVHGGMLVTVVDTMMGATVFHSLEDATCATISLTTDFLSAARAGDWVEGTARLVRLTRIVAFVSGELVVGDRRVLTATGTWAIIDRPPPAEGAAG